MDLTGQVALITGASRGIGKATAKAFADAGARVILSSRSKDALVAAASEIEGETAIFAANAGSPAQATACVDFAMDAFGRVDILVNNAATNPYFGPAIEIDLPRLDKTMEVNLRGPLLWSQECWKAWMGMNGGTIINISSIGGMSIEPGLGMYNVTKAALIHLRQSAC